MNISLVKFNDTLSIMRLLTNQFNKIGTVSAAFHEASQYIANMLYVSVSS